MTNQDIAEEMIRLYPSFLDTYDSVLLFFVLGTLNSLMNLGIVDGPYKLSKDGELIFIKLKEFGFNPSKDEIERMVGIPPKSIKDNYVEGKTKDGKTVLGSKIIGEFGEYLANKFKMK